MSDAFRQSQFLNVIDRDEAERRFRAHLDLRPLGPEVVSLADALGRVLTDDVVAEIDVPGFDRSNVDGFAVRAADTFGAEDGSPVILALTVEVIPTGIVPVITVRSGSASAIATGGVLPRGADAVVMIEHSSVADGQLILNRAVAPGGNVSVTGSDIGRGEIVLRAGDALTSRETGVLAAIGVARLAVVRKPRVAILSTGDELVPPGHPIRVGQIYDSNATVLADAVRELGAEPVPQGIIPDEIEAMRSALGHALECDVVLLSGGTSKGAGDVSYRVLNDFGGPGIIAHGVALKPGKPLCLAVIDRPGRRVPIAVLPGFPTSAVFTFHEFLAPVIRALGGHVQRPGERMAATLAHRVNSERGRTEYLLVNLVRSATEDAAPVAYPMGKGSGSVTAFARADGFITIGRLTEYLEAGAAVEVQLIGAGSRPADLVMIGSHCVGLDMLLGRLNRRGFPCKFLSVGSMGGVEAVRRGECDISGVHLLDETTGEYNRAFVPPGAVMVEGYGRLQGVVFRAGDSRFVAKSPAEAAEAACADPDCLLVNRNRGSGTRILIDRLLAGRRPAGYSSEAKSHQSVAAAVVQGRADWGVAIATVAADSGLGFLPLQDERYDFLIPQARWDRPAVVAFRETLADPVVRVELKRLGFAI